MRGQLGAGWERHSEEILISETAQGCYHHIGKKYRAQGRYVQKGEVQ